MFVEDARGQKRTAYAVRDDGVRYCSDCGKPMQKGTYYTRWTPYNPVSGKPGQMLVRCESCYPFKEIPRQPEDFDTPVRVPVYAQAAQNTTGSMQPVQVDASWLNSPPPKKERVDYGWRREQPTDISQVLTQLLPANQRSMRTDPKLWAILKELVVRR